MDAMLLPAAINGDKKSLSASAREQISTLNGSRPGAFSFELAWAWIVIIGAITWAKHMDTAWASAIAIFLVATRQNVLGLLVHDQAHLLGYRNKLGDLLVNLFAGFPLLLMTVEGYAQVHLAHHRDYFTSTDPDFLRKSGKDWDFPMRKMDLFKIFLKDLSGLNTIKVILGKNPSKDNPVFIRRHPTPKWVRPVYMLTIAGILTYTGMWTTFLLYWVLPLLSITQAIVRWGAICEHKYNLPNASVADSTPLIILSWWEKLLLPNLNFAMHPYHHFFPGVSFSLLPKVHEIFQKEGLVNEQNVFHGNLAYLKYITRTKQKAASAVET